ncbi:hypothetical protein ACKWRH_21350 [Bradyrhizobium sp. Pa8]|uniref:hypothetical protein n=1 Tax=Bradyrhizobium sp. Pa8 TaxID=3386552 RepID=UPI00403F5D8F
MTEPRKNYLIDGPPFQEPKRRAARVLEMAAILLEEPAYIERGDAVRCLHFRGYGVVDVMMLVDDARYEAHQQLVAKVISDE